MAIVQNPLSQKEKIRYTACKKQIQDGLQTCFDTGLAFREVRDSRLYREEFESFVEFFQKMYNISGRQAYRLIEAAEVKESLPASTSKLITNESQARALASVPEGDRQRTLLEISRYGKPVTAASIKAASEPEMRPIGHTSQPVKMGKSEKTPAELNGHIGERKDKTGYPIPKNVQPLWDQAETELREILLQLSSVRSQVRKVMEAQEENPVWRRVSANSVMVALDNAYREINAGVPFAVCPYCQGKVTKSCTACKQTGFVGKFDWTTSIPKELIAIREASAKK